MSTLTVANANPPFPAGTLVKAYPQKGFSPTTPTTGAPPGTEAGSGTVAAGGKLEVTGLVEQTYYLLAAEVSSVWQYLHVYIEASGEITVIATQATGDFAIMTEGKTLRVKEGANGKMGSGTLTAGKVTVANTSVTSESRIFVTRKGAAAKAGALTVTAKVAATSFTVESSNGEDASSFDYLILEPA